jgi:hypothetical protein
VHNPNTTTSSSSTNIDETLPQDFDTTPIQLPDHIINPSTNQITQESPDINQPMQDSVSSDISSSQINVYITLEKKGVIQYSSTGNTQLTPEARDIYRSFQPKPQLKETKHEPVDNEMELDSDTVNTTSNNTSYIVGTLAVNPTTEILEPHQSHLVVGSENDQEITVFATLTSEKGTKTLHIINEKTTTKLSEKQPISGENKGQYAKTISPPLTVNSHEFIEDEATTQYVNTPDVKEKLMDLKKETERYVPIAYDSTGITKNDLQDLGNAINTTNHEEVD